ncbi:MAG TPA: hypothetical protein VGU66_03245 [Candidatus Elarobacter sp.]|nr:hypothetical protein [Candidatus Elarobacter sp.]
MERDVVDISLVADVRLSVGVIALENRLPGALAQLKNLSLRDIGRAVLQRLEATPALGLLLVVSWKKRRLAFRDSFITVCCGLVGIWLPLLLRYGIDAQATFDESMTKVALRGEVFILVPSLVAPLYLLLAALKDNKRMRRHQVGLFTYAAIASMLALFFWGRNAHAEHVNTALVAQSAFAFLSAFGLLYLYHLVTDLPDSVLEGFKRTSKSLTTDVINRRKLEGK